MYDSKRISEIIDKIKIYEDVYNVVSLINASNKIINSNNKNLIVAQIQKIISIYEKEINELSSLYGVVVIHNVPISDFSNEQNIDHLKYLTNHILSYELWKQGKKALSKQLYEEIEELLDSNETRD